MDALFDRPRVVAIGGPTATGKTALSVGLAKRFGGEIINADSMQVYRELSVGTAKATEEERSGIQHHLLDFLPPEESYSVADFVEAATELIPQITALGHLPLVVGGTGLYITSLLNGITFAPERSDPAIRKTLQQEAEEKGAGELYDRLKKIDPEYAAKVHPHNLPRIIRALELFQITGRRMSEQQQSSRPEIPPYRSLCLCLTCRDRGTLYRRIDQRVDTMLEQGILPEAKMVWQHKGQYQTAAQAIGYKEFFPYFEGTQSLEECTVRLKQATRQYAKRQLTWFRHQNEAVWLYTDEEDVLARATELVHDFLQN
ncbi:tRNA (adenosine(37)-N6)-dimethylallyltransferase MiaA [Subdoligranulum variabile]|uniref:tRNA dimethylallyltransferase n=1 Tax=Subdoligranulum variabile DSM 15176 TaxID=411471 RepID=D1PL27_9FIRM|nr:tRNA (adenosine(37)-N6)-dimethylallyltransferase MiaA [Subdoligranulum variabile]EFB76685.1 tRNA dimethylallyltransferase [Subdoligranulum variabile DSM 15176]UWP68084.1 tRNA (adenosine(37)-N6)-dimethylallyltransferase MiaA [Subdoligranulum variabile]